jgi:SAM-dependent methyltransferase
MTPPANCHLCGSDKLIVLADFSGFHQVTSDCKPWKRGGRKGCCAVCGTVQAVIDESWRQGCHEIYSSYSVYHQGGGQEQAVFEANSNAGTPRSKKLLEKMTTEIDLPEIGRALDIGCGNGNFIRSLAAIRPRWNLNGAEYNTHYEEQVRAIPGVEDFFSGGIEGIPGQFDFVSLIHVLEHIENPVSFLQKIAALAPRGKLVIEVPFCRENPYELLIADHATHYTPATLTRILQRAGFSVISMRTDWIAKEISAVAIPSAMAPRAEMDPKLELGLVNDVVRYLNQARIHAEKIRAQTESFGVFGTSIGGTWLYTELEGNIEFFVDEDLARIGKRHLDIEILSPAHIPSGSSVFMPLAEGVARDIAQRLRGSPAGTEYFYQSSRS